jgi:hypothetical protein
LRVAYGVDEKGRILDKRGIVRHGLVIDMVADKPEGLASLRGFLVRAGVVDTPSEWKLNETETVEVDAIPLGIEWVQVDLKPESQSSRKRGRSAKSSTKKRRNDPRARQH